MTISNPTQNVIIAAVLDHRGMFHNLKIYKVGEKSERKKSQ
jgi:hypothetical protein